MGKRLSNSGMYNSRMLYENVKRKKKNQKKMYMWVATGESKFGRQVYGDNYVYVILAIRKLFSFLMYNVIIITKSITKIFLCMGSVEKYPQESILYLRQTTFLHHQKHHSAKQGTDRTAKHPIYTDCSQSEHLSQCSL
jgi:hypothetical protein